jgi:DNA-binding transcriptional ArsR family regulator
METKKAAALFEVLASEARLAIFRLLIKHTPNGLVAGEIAHLTGIPKTNLSFHLKNLVHSGLADMERQGRNTRYRANIQLMLNIITYLASECCSEHPELCIPLCSQHGIAPAFLPPDRRIKQE